MVRILIFVNYIEDLLKIILLNRLFLVYFGIKFFHHQYFFRWWRISVVQICINIQNDIIIKIRVCSLLFKIKSIFDFQNNDLVFYNYCSFHIKHWKFISHSIISTFKKCTNPKFLTKSHYLLKNCLNHLVKVIIFK